jgi:hypothetical protein
MRIGFLVAYFIAVWAAINLAQWFVTRGGMDSLNWFVSLLLGPGLFLGVSHTRFEMTAMFAVFAASLSVCAMLGGHVGKAGIAGLILLWAVFGLAVHW